MKEKTDVNVPVYEIAGMKDPMFKLNLSPKITKKMRKILEKFDVVHCHHAFARLPLTGIHAADMINIPSVLTTHTVSLFPDAEYLWRPLSYGYPRYRLQISKVKKIIAVSESAKTFIEYFADENKIRVIPNGVDVNRFSPDNKNEKGDNRPTILYMGRLVPKKGVPVLIRAMKNIVKKYPDALLIVGGKGKMKTFLSSYANTLGLKENVRFLGYVPDSMLPSLYSSSDVFVLPSTTSESFGITLLEAMASGTPVIGSSVGGIPEVIGDCGFIVEPGNPKKVSDAVITLLDDENLREKLGRKGRKRVEEKYSWDIIGKNIINVYKEVM
jgi:glycosyltransferase involved in cell wall biosynthesis